MRPGLCSARGLYAFSWEEEDQQGGLVWVWLQMPSWRRASGGGAMCPGILVMASFHPRIPWWAAPTVPPPSPQASSFQIIGVYKNRFLKKKRTDSWDYGKEVWRGSQILSLSHIPRSGALRDPGQLCCAGCAGQSLPTHSPPLAVICSPHQWHTFVCSVSSFVNFSKVTARS